MLPSIKTVIYNPSHKKVKKINNLKRLNDKDLKSKGWKRSKVDKTN